MFKLSTDQLILLFAALLSHQLEQMFKLERELRQEKQEMGVVKSDVQVLILFPPNKKVTE